MVSHVLSWEDFIGVLADCHDVLTEDTFGGNAQKGITGGTSGSYTCKSWRGSSVQRLILYVYKHSPMVRYLS